MKLVRAELERLLARRFVQLMLVLLVFAATLTVATTLAGSHRPTAEELAQARATAAQELTKLEAEFDRCRAAKRGEVYTEEFRKLSDDCHELDPILRDQLPTTADYVYGVFVFDREAESLMYFLITFLVLFGFLIGASYIGADLNSGAMTSLLLWRPQRITVLGTKLGTLLAVVAVVSLVTTAGYLGAFWVVGQVAGLPGTVDAEFWQHLGVRYARGLALVLMSAALGFVIATLGRHTAAALGTVAAYLVVWELGARLVMDILDMARPDQWMFSSYLSAWLAGSVNYWDRSVCLDDVYGNCDGTYTLTWLPALVVLLGLTGVLTAAAFATFRRRDLA